MPLTLSHPHHRAGSQNGGMSFVGLRCVALCFLAFGISIKPSSQVWYSSPFRDHFRKALVARLMPCSSSSVIIVKQQRVQGMVRH